MAGYVAPVRFRPDCPTCIDLASEGRSTRLVAGHAHVITEPATYKVESLQTALFGLGVTPVGPGLAIPDPDGGLTADTVARNAIVDILNVLRGVGLIETSP